MTTTPTPADFIPINENTLINLQARLLTDPEAHAEYKRDSHPSESPYDYLFMRMVHKRESWN